MDGFYTGKPLFPNGMIWGYKTGKPTYFWRSIQDNNLQAFCSHLSGWSKRQGLSTFWTPRRPSASWHVSLEMLLALVSSPLWLLTHPWKLVPWRYILPGWMSVVPGGVLEINFVSSKNFYQGHGGKRQPFAKISTTIAAVFF